MDEVRKLEAKGLARAKSRSRRRRVSTIRSRTIRGSLALFAVLWGIVFVQLASGNDPALSTKQPPARHVRLASNPPGRNRRANRRPKPKRSSTARNSKQKKRRLNSKNSKPNRNSKNPPRNSRAEPEIEEPIVTSSS